MSSEAAPREQVVAAALVSAALIGAGLAMAAAASRVDAGTFVVLAVPGTGSYLLVALLARPGGPPGLRQLGLVLGGGVAWAGLIFAFLWGVLPLVASAGTVDVAPVVAAVLFGGAQLWLAQSTKQAASAAGPRPRLRRAASLAVTLVVLLAWIVVPLPLVRRHPSGGESPSIGDLRTFSSAQAAYQLSNGGLYGSTECLVTPQRCIPDYAATGPTFLGPEFLRPSRRGYFFSFHPGPVRRTERGYQGFDAWAYAAVPEHPGETGVRSFCVDASGVLRFGKDSHMPTPVAGECPPAAAPLD